MNGIKVLDRPASQNFYAVAGRLLFVQSSEPQLAAQIEQLFAGWQLAPVSFTGPSPNITISFRISEGLPEVPGGLHQFEIADGGRCHTTNDGFYLIFDNSLVRLQGNNPVDVSVNIRKIRSPTAAELARVTSFAVCAALRRFGIFELHSAGVVVPNTEAGVVIIGSSGSGKSTLTAKLATAGWGYLSDDELLLTVVDQTVEARGFRSFFALRHDGPFKHCFEPGEVFDSRRIAQAMPQFLLFATISGAEKTEVRELTQAETMTRLIRACPWATYDTLVAGPYLDLLSRLSRQTHGFELMAGTDLLDASEASRIIGSVCRN